jgi:hypothetical protein
MKNNNVVENFEFWKHLVGLDDDFPKLSSIKIKDKDMELVQMDPQQRKAIDETIQSNGLTVITVPKGWGATTLFKYMFYEYTKLSANRMKISIQFDLEGRESFPNLEDMMHSIKWQIANGFLSLINSNPLEKRYIYEVIGYEDVSGGTTATQYIRLCKNGIDDLKSDPEKFLGRYAFFQRPLENILGYLLTNLQLQTVFFYLFPNRVGEDDMNNFVYALKQIFDGKHFESAAKREIFFCTSNIFRALNISYERPYAVYDYPRYSSAEVFKMLANRHRPISLRTAAGREEKASLGTVFSHKFVDHAYSEKKTINGIIETIENLIKNQLDCSRSEIPFMLTLNNAKEEEM